MIWTGAGVDPASRIDYVRALHACTVRCIAVSIMFDTSVMLYIVVTGRKRSVSVTAGCRCSLSLSLTVVVSPPHPYPLRTPHNITPTDEFSSHGAVCMFQAQAPIEYCSLCLNSKRGSHFSREIFKSLRLVLV